ncbi:MULTISPECIES: TetR/AcrR family transcriptional regulator [unclassified Vibrio]|uniref:TetR/AcrR family transcriptional regulator n=1 Tax=unclassified Vibrio TaxID=2614977 RepID=UPI000B8E9C53|nr:MULTISPECIES: TetR/AcrR family transcriptional regulator [unclassified Vibrio]NAW90990.1 TetR family transcriptional regulator [Vibrio sp. V24_P1S3T111]OXX24494.1 hypothetical protein B9J88_05670 [Vibrio sp. V05_P4A8T149]OXX29254.1 hypothetical protein B9J95_13925 [Vibrio sp. V14_P6S14T42]OXX30138.1 hypothetical protein B9J81_16680 [Vibrio sp. V04_P4A5T148]OXX51632.1 hypothetical protein B9J91_16795 [Vibrio sp. V18_P1S4T112]
MTGTQNRLTGRKLEIIEVSKKLFLSKGYDSTSIAMILTELGIAKGTLYHHFQSKDDILLAVITDTIDKEKEKTLKLVDTIEFNRLNPLQKLLALIRNADISTENAELISALHVQDNANMQAKMLGNYIEKFAPIYSSIIEEGNEVGLFNTCFPLESAELIIGGFQFLTDLGFYDWDENSIVRRSKAMFSIIENVLGAQKGALLEEVG